MTLPSYVGRYEVRKEIGRGGFAVVVQAWDEELQSLVALKILHGELAHDEEFQLRFLEEARLLRRIRSSNVVTVHDVGRLNDGRPYFVMDFADRGTLAPRLEGRDTAHRTLKALLRLSMPLPTDSRPFTTPASCIAISSPTTYCSRLRAGGSPNWTQWSSSWGGALCS